MSISTVIIFISPTFIFPIDLSLSVTVSYVMGRLAICLKAIIQHYSLELYCILFLLIYKILHIQIDKTVNYQ